MKILTDKKLLKDNFDKLINKWHNENTINFDSENNFLYHAFDILSSNYKLWHLEDLARDPDANDKIIADVKRKIDKENQSRNDKIEKLDLLINDYLINNNIIPKTDNFNSETPGSIIDRTTILSLKIYHMYEETVRTDATEEHIGNCKNKLSVLKTQRDDLLNALSILITELLNGKKTHKIYFQFKMYNDPSLNPVLYKNK